MINVIQLLILTASESANVNMDPIELEENASVMVVRILIRF